ncbi:MAG: hypothetical protein ACYDIC_20470 [Desulfobaccales bacterium]
MKKMIAAMILVATWIFTCVLLGAAELPPIPSIPDNLKDIQIVKPDSSVPKEIAALLGEYEGVLMGRHPLRRVKIIVYEVSAQKIKFLSGAGDHVERSRDPGGWSNNESDLYLEREKYRFSRRLDSGFAANYYFENGSLKGMLSLGANLPALFYELKKIK